MFSPSINHDAVSPLCEAIKITEITLKINVKTQRVIKTLHVMNAANGTFITL